MSSLRVCIAAGGTAGHIFPGLELSKTLRDRGVDVLWFGSQGGLEARLVSQAGFKLITLSMRGVRGRGLRGVFAGSFLMAVSVVQAVRALLREQIACVVGFGGYVSAPAGLAAWLLRKPLIIHDQNVIAGSANRLLEPLARRVLCGLPCASDHAPRLATRAELVGNLVRREIAEVPPCRQRSAGEPLQLLVIGGSRGASVLNATLPVALSNLNVNFGRAVEGISVRIVHQTGAAEHDAVGAMYGVLGKRCLFEARVERFIDDMSAAYAQADLVICRAGALTIAELAAAGRGAILVPMPGASDDHQTANAKWLQAQGGAILLEQRDFDARSLASLLQELWADPQRCSDMGAAARQTAHDRSAQLMADICLEEMQ